MKPSYKLYGTFWDNKSVSSKNYEIQCYSEKLRSECSLILSEVLSTEQPIEISSFEGKRVDLLLDYMPENKATIVWDFYLTRLLQIIEYYNIEVIICNDQKQASLLEKAIDDYYKKKTPNGLLAQSNGVL